MNITIKIRNKTYSEHKYSKSTKDNRFKKQKHAMMRSCDNWSDETKICNVSLT